MCRQTCHQKLLQVAIQNQNSDSSLLANPSAIGDMGQQGWELVIILQTPATTTQTVSVCENYQSDVDVFPAASG
jgi:hypothetical protein